MEKIYKILGKRGRITIPYELRLKHGFAYNDVVSFEETDKETIVIRREKICDRCKVPVIEEKSTSLLDVLNSLTIREQKAAFKYLAKRLADLEDD